MNPADLPDAQDAGPPTSTLQTVVYFVVWAALIGWVVWYLVRKLRGLGESVTAGEPGQARNGRGLRGG